MVWWKVLVTVIVAYFFGNISIARIISKKKNSDVTKLGSGNPGSTNMLRNFGFKIGFLNFILDILKGLIPTLAALLIFGSKTYAYVAGLAVILGHIFPVVYKFKGGKGIASMLGVFLATNPLVTLVVTAVAAISWLCFEYGSVASFLCVTALTVIEGFNAKALPAPDQNIICLLLFAIFLVTWWAHRGNITRLLVGKESKVSLIKRTKKVIKNIKKESEMQADKKAS